MMSSGPGPAFTKCGGGALSGSGPAPALTKCGGGALIGSGPRPALTKCAGGALIGGWPRPSLTKCGGSPLIGGGPRPALIKCGGGALIGGPSLGNELAMAEESLRSFAGECGRCASTFRRGRNDLSRTRIGGGVRGSEVRLEATSGLTIGGGHRRGRQSGRGRQQGTMAPICKTSSLRSRKRICLACWFA